MSAIPRGLLVRVVSEPPETSRGAGSGAPVGTDAPCRGARKFAEEMRLSKGRGKDKGQAPRGKGGGAAGAADV